MNTFIFDSVRTEHTSEQTSETWTVIFLLILLVITDY